MVKRKLPKLKSLILKGNIPRHGDLQQYDDYTPIWSFKKIDCGSKWCWNCLDPIIFKGTLQKLKEIETQKWSQIKASKKLHHTIEVNNLTQDAKSRLIKLQYDELEELFSLHLGGKFRVYGIRVGVTLELLWFDKEHEIYPTHKKHT